jgi:hypothetical protein
MIWCYLAVLPALWKHVIAQFNTIPRALLCALLFFSGFVSLLGGLDATHRGYPIASRSELDGVASALRGIPGHDRFIGHPTFNHPLLLLGRPMALGYTGHAWSHGLEWRETLGNVESVLAGNDDWRAAANALGSRFIFWGREEREHYPDSQQPWKSEAALVAAGDRPGDEQCVPISWYFARERPADFDLRRLATVAVNDLDGQLVVEVDRLHHRADVVEAIRAPVQHLQPEVDFGRAVHCDAVAHVRRGNRSGRFGTGAPGRRW